MSDSIEVAASMEWLRENALFSCQFEDCARETTYPAEMLRVYNGKPVCDNCSDAHLPTTDWMNAPAFDPFPTAPAPSVPDELVEAVRAYIRASWHSVGVCSAQMADRITPEDIFGAAKDIMATFAEMEAALSLPRRTEADIRADGERVKAAGRHLWNLLSIEMNHRGSSDSVRWRDEVREALAKWSDAIRSQGGEDE